MNHTITTTSIIAQPLEHVFTYVTTPGTWPQWHPASLKVDGATDHSLAVGEQVREEFLVAGRHGFVVWTVRERHAPLRWVIDGQIEGGAGGGTVAYTLAPHPRGTRFVRAFTYRVQGHLNLLLHWLIIRPRIVGESQAALRRLKSTLESHQF